MEMIDIYDSEENYKGTASREEVHLKGLWHRSFHCWGGLRNQPDPHILFQRRGSYKQDFPNYLDITAAGHYMAGETIEGGIRELREELGIDVSYDQLCKMGVRIINEQHDDGTINREFQDIYFLKSGLTLSDLNVGYPEVTSICSLSVTGLRDLFIGDRTSLDGINICADPQSGHKLYEVVTVTRADFIPSALVYLAFIMKVALFLLTTPLGASSLREPDWLHRQITLADGSRWRPEKLCKV